MLNYIYRFYKDIYTLENTGLVTLTYSIYIVNCDSTTLLKECTILPGVTVTLPITKMDGIYNIVITDGTDTETIENILQYYNLLNSFIFGAAVTLCNCNECGNSTGCKDCSACTECDKFKNNLLTINQGLAFFHVNSPKYNAYLTTISESLKCNYNETVVCNLINGIIKGEEDVFNLNMLNIAVLYLTFYMLDLAQAQDEEEANYIKNKYNASTILKCIKKLGIDAQDLNEEFFTDMEVYYYQYDNTEENITDFIADFNSTTLVGKPVLPFSEFEDGEIISYTEIGRAIFAIKETDILNFTLIDSLGNDITDEFDNHYFATERTVVFVSKNPFTYSNVFFKFKKITNFP